MRLETKRKPKKCPICTSADVVDIIYGIPSYELFQQAENRKVALGGCCITDDDPKWKCLDCEIEIYKELTGETL